jgi:hypothetical protein
MNFKKSISIDCQLILNLFLKLRLFNFLNLRKCLLQVIMKLAVARVTILSCLLRLGAGGLHHHDILFEPSHPQEELGGPGSSTADLTGGPGHSAADLTGGPGHSTADVTDGLGPSAAGLTGGPGHSAASLTGGPGHSAAGLGSGLANPAAQADTGLRHPVILVPGDGGSQVRNRPAQYLKSCTVSIRASLALLVTLCEKFFVFCLFSKVAWPNCLLNENGEPVVY